MNHDKPDEVKLIRVRLRGQAATAYHLAETRLAERLADGARQAGDHAEILDPSTFAAAAALAPRVQPRQLHLVGIQYDDGRWVQPPETGQAAQRN